MSLRYNIIKEDVFPVPADASINIFPDKGRLITSNVDIFIFFLHFILDYYDVFEYKYFNLFNMF